MTNTTAGLRERFRSGEPLVWAFMMIPDQSVADVIGRSGFDYALLDLEHGGFDLTTLRSSTTALQAAATPVMVRVGSHDAGSIHRILELGVDGVLVPHVSNEMEAAAAVRAIRFPPRGARGITGPTRAFGYSLPPDPEAVDARTVAAVLIESREGVENVAAIAATPGLDAIYIGPNDLATDMGFLGEPTHPEVIAASEHIVETAVAVGINVCCPYDADFAKAKGLTHVSAFLDVAGLAGAAESALARVRETIGT
jgi:4-hydroxy-2-oxoheptanedioate aldolase